MSTLVLFLTILAVVHVYARNIYSENPEGHVSDGSQSDIGADGGLPDAGKDEAWLNGGGAALGKRNIKRRRINHKLYNEKRCLGLFDDGCANGGFPGAGNDEGWFNGGGTPGKRCLGLFDDGCANGGFPGAGNDEGWFNGGGTPGKRCLGLFGNGCANSGFPGAGNDEKRNLYTAPQLYKARKCSGLSDDGCINDGLVASDRFEINDVPNINSRLDKSLPHLFRMVYQGGPSGEK